MVANCGCNKPVCQSQVFVITTATAFLAAVIPMLPKPIQYAVFSGTVLALSYKFELPKQACEYVGDWPVAHELCDLMGVDPDSE